MDRIVKITNLALVLVGIAATVYLSGGWRNRHEVKGITMMVFTCFPLTLFQLASLLSKTSRSAVWVLGITAFGVLFGAWSYYSEFWRGHPNEASAIVLLFCPALQFVAAIGALILRIRVDRRYATAIT